jgi:hypothetical protein
MKLCKDCKHMVAAAIPFGPTFPMCIHPSAPVDPVYGRKNASCDLMRSANCLVKPACGHDGDWFEQAPDPEPVPKIKACYGVTIETARDRSFWEKAKGWFI